MRKKLAIILISSMALSLSACGDTRSENVSTSLNDITAEIDSFVESEDETDEENLLIDGSIEQQEGNRYNSISELKLDELQQLYLNFNSSLSYLDAIDYIVSVGLPYSEEKNNGSRTIQIAFTEESTSQTYKKDSGDYLTIIYVYPKNENSSNDDLDKYLFGTCCYTPADSTLQLIEHKNGYYYSYYEPGNYISKLGTKLEFDSSITKEEQMLYYFNEK